MPRQKNRKQRSDAGKARGPYVQRSVVNPISTVNMKVRFANSTSYAAKAGISPSYSYKCRDCGVLFTRVGAIDHYPQDCMELNGKPWFNSNPAVGVIQGRSNLPPTITPHEALVSDVTVTAPAALNRELLAADLVAQSTAQEPVDIDHDFTLGIQDITEYLEWITEERNDALRALEEAQEELAKVKNTRMSTEFWTTYREFRDK
jgi:hypothetical protein